jgi:PTH1 family peptidyl-tRNA hydrolase
MYLLVGLGNPGKEYAKHRHNVGFMVIDAICDEYGFGTPKSKFKGIVSEGEIGGEKIVTLKPSTYMNLSGRSVVEAIKFYKIPLDKIIVFHDDIDLVFAKIKVKTGGGAGGHNGLKDMDNTIGKEYKRVRIGVGHPGDRDMVADYVLSNFSKDEFSALEKIIPAITKNVDFVLQNKDEEFLKAL